MNNDRNSEIPTYRKALDAGLMAVGLALFVLLSAKGVSSVDSMDVVAGQKNNGAVYADSKSVLPFNSGTQASLFTIKESSTEASKPTKIKSKQVSVASMQEIDPAKIPESAKAKSNPRAGLN